MSNWKEPKEAEVLPFEDAQADFAHINEHLRKNAAYQTCVIPDAYINSCSECCKRTINGKPNLLGMMFRNSRKGMGCRFCPVSLASEKLPHRNADGAVVQGVTRADMVRIAMDSDE